MRICLVKQDYGVLGLELMKPYKRDKYFLFTRTEIVNVDFTSGSSNQELKG